MTWVCLVISIAAFSIAALLVASKRNLNVSVSKQRLGERDFTSICKVCGRPIYWANGYQIWWEVPAQGSVTRKNKPDHEHQPVGTDA